MKGAKREKLLEDADQRFREIAASIYKGLIVRPDIPLLSALLKRFMYEGFIRSIHDADKNFIADERCTSCGTCAAVCPVKNIEMIAGLETPLRTLLCLYPLLPGRGDPVRTENKKTRALSPPVAYLS